jgi:type VI protein secretion system component VasK
MNINMADFYYLWQKLAFQIVHKTTIWLLLALFVTAISAWHLGSILNKHNARERETILSRKIAIGYTATAFALWLFSIIMG